jgi:Immunoglobulin domain
MKTWIAVTLAFVAQWVHAESFPVFSIQPTNETVFPGSTVTMSISAEGATSYQWRFNGTDINGATGSTLQITNVQTTNSGYYVVIAKNPVGWVPSQMAYLSLDYTYGGTVPSGAGVLPFSNTNFTYFDGQISYAQSCGDSVQIVAGPELDQMQPVGSICYYGVHTYYQGLNPFPLNYFFTNGFYGGPQQSLNTVAPGQAVYYSILVNYTNSQDPGYTFTQPSTIINLNAGTNGFTAPSSYGLKFPDWPEWPEPDLSSSPATQQLLVAGETLNFSNLYGGYTDFGLPTIQWRKDGENIAGATNFPYTAYPDGFYGPAVFTITNLQASDAGVYDTIIYGNDWEVSPKIYVSIQTTNGQGVFQNPKFGGTNFVFTLLGAAGRNYDLQWSSNLVSWINLATLTNVTGTITFTNTSILGNPQFYRTLLLPPP